MHCTAPTKSRTHTGLSGQMEIFLYGIFRYSEPYGDINTPDSVSRQEPESATHFLATSYKKNPDFIRNQQAELRFFSSRQSVIGYLRFSLRHSGFGIFACRPILGLYNSGEITILVW